MNECKRGGAVDKGGRMWRKMSGHLLGHDSFTCARFSTTKNSSVKPRRAGCTNVGGNPPVSFSNMFE